MLSIGQYLFRPGCPTNGARPYLSEILQIMPITQRICEPSDALLMIKEGCLVDYVMSCGDNLPKVNLKERIIEINKGLGCGLSEAFKIYQAEQTSQERFLEIGDKITLVNRKGNWELYLKHEGFWIRSARLATSLDSLCTESSMFQPISFNILCSESEIRRATDIVRCYRMISYRHVFYGAPYRFGNNENWKHAGDGTGNVCIYGRTPKEMLIHVDRIEEHIKEYKAAQKIGYGVF